jgi:hypothetical protein
MVQLTNLQLTVHAHTNSELGILLFLRSKHAGVLWVERWATFGIVVEAGNLTGKGVGQKETRVRVVYAEVGCCT